MKFSCFEVGNQEGVPF